MAGRKLTVVISQSPGKNPVKRQLEEDIATQLMLSGTAEVSVVPHLYDLSSDHTGMIWLRSLKGNLVVLGWLYPRAIRWVLDRNGVKGKAGESRLNQASSEDDEESEEEVSAQEPETGIGAVDVPNRMIYAIDLRDHADAETYLGEIKRLSNELATPLVQISGLFGDSLSPAPTPAAAKAAPTGFSFGIPPLNPAQETSSVEQAATSPLDGPKVIPNENVRRRWYPVIDYSRCTNCMECLDFCLFGVYGVDMLDRILVEQEDNCKKGCPACSRVCPANAIVFPEHKTPAIAGALGGAAEDFKIDLSKLFGAPTALEMAVLERDTELVADGREAVGVSVGVPKRQASRDEQPRDALDDLMDGLDSLDL